LYLLHLYQVIKLTVYVSALQILDGKAMSKWEFTIAQNDHVNHNLQEDTRYDCLFVCLLIFKYINKLFVLHKE